MRASRRSFRWFFAVFVVGHILRVDRLTQNVYMLEAKKPLICSDLRQGAPPVGVPQFCGSLSIGCFLPI